MHLGTGDSEFVTQPLSFQLLGGFVVCCGDSRIEEQDWNLRSAANLVKLLCLIPAHRLHREEIVDHLWPDRDPISSSNNLRYTVHVARRAMRSICAQEVISRQGELLTLQHPSGIEIDVEQFIEHAQRARKVGDVQQLQRALGLYRGDLLPADHYEDWTTQKREVLRTTYLELLLELAGQLERQGEISAAISALERVIIADRASEEAHSALMRLYLNRGQRQRAIRQFELLRAALRDELDVDPDPLTQRLYQDILTGKYQLEDAPTVPSADAPEAVRSARTTGNLPSPLTSFIGRENEVLELRTIVQHSRLVTLVGTAGAGKTRLALEVARGLDKRFDDGVLMLELGALSDPALVPATLASLFGVIANRDTSMLESIARALQGQRVLVLFDNCEHLTASCRETLNQLLSSCPDLHVLATSRERLHVHGELTWQVGSLSTPPKPATDEADEVVHYEAVQLFRERAALVQSGFEISAANAGAVAAVCTLLNGLPLAIELAAARLTALTPAELASRLSDALSVLSLPGPSNLPHHRTLRATLDWSSGLLTVEERTLLARLSVFRNGWLLAAAESVCGFGIVQPETVLRDLAQLVDKSLVTVDLEGDQSRYHLLEVVRQYAAEHLRSSCDMYEVCERHAEFYAAYTESAQVHYTGPVPSVWKEQVGKELDNLRTALDWSIQNGHVDEGLRLAGAMGDFWFVSGRQSEGQRWLSAILNLPGAFDEERLALSAQVLATLFIISYRQGNYQESLELAETYLELQTRLGDRRRIAWALNSMAMPVGELGDLERSEQLLEQSLALSRETRDPLGIARSLDTLGELNRARKNYPRARELYRESLELFRKINAAPHIAIVLHNLGKTAIALNEPTEAIRQLQESLAYYQEVDHAHGKIFCLSGLAAAASMMGQDADAVELLGAVHTLQTTFSVVPDAADRAHEREVIESLRSRLGERRFEQKWQIGTQLELDEAIERALTLDHRTVDGIQPGIQSLTHREHEIAALVAEGMTNREIAEQLGLSKRTADTHVSRILQKLGLTSRSEIARRLSTSS